MTNERRARILIVHPVVPYPPNQGSKVATFGMIQSLHEEFDVTVLGKVFSPREMTDATALEQWCEHVVAVLPSNKRSFFHRMFYKAWYYARSLFQRRSLKSLYDNPGNFVGAARALAKEPFDLVFVVYWQLFPMLGVFPRDRTVLVTYDIDLLVNRQMALLERHLFRKLQAVRNWLLERREEIETYRAVSRVWTLTERDKESVEIITRGEAQVDIMPFRLDTDFFSPPGMSRNGGEVLLLGHMGAVFNRDALEYFVRKIYPHLDAIEGLSITVVGGELPPALAYFGLNPEVEVVGRVPDVRPYLHRAACTVIPLRFAGGLRVRILEAMAAGLPVVCSRPAAAGLPFEPDTHYLVADEPEVYARQIGRLLKEPELAHRLSERAMEGVRERFGAAAQAERLRGMVRAVLAGG